MHNVVEKILTNPIIKMHWFVKVLLVIYEVAKSLGIPIAVGLTGAFLNSQMQQREDAKTIREIYQIVLSGTPEEFKFVEVAYQKFLKHDEWQKIETAKREMIERKLTFAVQTRDKKILSQSLHAYQMLFPEQLEDIMKAASDNSTDEDPQSGTRSGLVDELLRDKFETKKKDNISNRTFFFEGLEGLPNSLDHAQIPSDDYLPKSATPKNAK